MIRFTPKTIEAYDLFHKGILALARAERNGICCDVDYCLKMQAHLTRQIERIEGRLQDTKLVKDWKRIFRNDFNMNSNDQLGKMLFDHMGIAPTKVTGTGKPSVDEESLGATGVAEVQDLLRIRELAKARDTYLGNFLREQVDGVIHTNFNLHFARSFRPSTDSPNLANVPNRQPEIKKICRRGIKARKGRKLICADFKGIEVGIAACYHKDPEMMVYLNDKTKDMHRDMAMKLYVLEQIMMNKAIRNSGKGNFVFPEFYGDWWKSCAHSLWADAHLPTHVLPDGTRLIDHLHKKGYRTLEQYEKLVEEVENWMWFEKWPIYTKWKKDWVKEYERNGYFDTLTGFTCQGVMDRKQAVNYPIQGSAFHCLLQCIIWMDEDSTREGWDSFVCNQIYDDLMMDVHPDEEKMVVERLQYYMREKIKEHWKWVIVPMDVEIEATPVDGSWYDKSEKFLFAA